MYWNSKRDLRRWFRCFSGLAALLALTSTGCQVDIAGQTLPSPFYLQDDLQYFPHGPEFKLSREAAAMRRFEAEQLLEEEIPRPLP